MELSPLADPDTFADPEQVKDMLAGDLRQGSLAVFLGAGASFSFGLPAWDHLVGDVAAAAGCTVPGGLGSEDAADFILAHVANDDLRLARLIQQVMYAGGVKTPRELLGTPLVAALGALTGASIRGHATEVVTFNYDDYLEMYLRYHGLVVESVSQLPAWDRKADVKLLHFHGLLSPHAEVTQPVVFSQSSYDRIVGKTGAMWRQVVLRVMASNTCVFVGLSGKDNNLKSLLTEANEIHVGRPSRSFWGVRFTASASDPYRSTWEQRGVKQIDLGSYDVLPEWLLDVCRRAAAIG